MTSGRTTRQLRRLIVIGEIALSLILLVGAGLSPRSFYRLREIDPGFRPDRVLTFRLSLPQASYPEQQQTANFYREMVRRLESLPGVEAGGLIVSRVLASLLYGVGSADPFSFVGTTLVLGAAALLASYLPARRALRVDPVKTLRYE